MIHMQALVMTCFLSAAIAAAAPADHWLYPYAAAMILVAKTVPDNTGQHLAAGDTVAVWHVTSSVAHNAARPGEAIESTAIADQVAGRELHVGQSVVFRLRYRLGRWFFDPRAVESESD